MSAPLKKKSIVVVTQKMQTLSKVTELIFEVTLTIMPM